MGIVTERFVEALVRARRRLFHFTDARNIPGIIEHGLLPTSTIMERNINVVTGGDEASLQMDRQKNLDAHVSLSFCRSHPMSHVAKEEGRIETLRIITVCPTVLLRPGALVADQVATANAATIRSPEEMIPLMDMTATYDRLDWGTMDGQQRRAAAEKWEALIPGAISTDLIVGL